jgi:tetratricopeptide (TPR) repeat protein
MSQLSPQQSTILAVDLINQQRFVEAERLLRQLITAVPDLSIGHDLLGALLTLLERPKEAIPHLQRAITLAPDNASAYGNLGIAFSQIGDTKASIASLERAVHLDKTNVKTFRAIMQGHARQNSLSKWAETVNVFRDHHSDQQPAIQESILELLENVDHLAKDFPVKWKSLCTAGVFSVAYVDRVTQAVEQPTNDTLTTLFKRQDVNADVAETAILAAAAYYFSEIAGVTGRWIDGAWQLFASFVSHARHSARARRVLVKNGLGYTLASRREWNKGVFNHIVLPSISKLLAQEDWTMVWHLDGLTAFSYAQQPLTEAQFAACLSVTMPLYDRVLSLQHSTPAFVPPITRSNIAYISDLDLCNCSPVNLCLELAQGGRPTFNPFFISFALTSQDIRLRLQQHGIPLIDLDKERGSILVDNMQQRLERLRSEIQKHRIEALIFFNCTNFFEVLASRLCIAPVQIYLSMGFHTTAGKWDGLISLGGAWYEKKSRLINKNYWLMLPVTTTVRPTRSSDLISGKILRSRLASNAIVLSTIARPEKIDSEEFLDSLAILMRKNPRAVFLWFGRNERSSVRQRMMERNISDRCHFQGWVETNKYSNVIDIHLDAFPYPTGISMRETMAAGVAMVLTSGTQMAGAVADEILPAYSGQFGEEAQEVMRDIFVDKQGRDLLCCADTPEEWVSQAQKLIDDPGRRKAVGNAARTFYERFTAGSSATQFADHVKSIIGRRGKVISESICQ